MKLKEIAKIQSGYISRGKIEPREDGTYFLLQARDVDAERLTYKADSLVRFSPDLSRKDWALKSDDVLFMARGARNYSVLLQRMPDFVLAAACFFIVRVSNEEALPSYLCWFLNQAPVKHYMSRHSGRGVHMPVVRRAVLENIDIPLPSLKTQKKIVELDSLMREEKKLLDKLAVKRRELITTACMQAVRNNS